MTNYFKLKVESGMWKVKKTFNPQLSTLNSESGQILIIILLVLVVGVSIVLSLSARSLTDIRTTTSTEQSNRAYFAAEAGIERALQQIKDGGISGVTSIVGYDSPLANQAKYTGNIEITGGSTNAFAYNALKDQTVQVNLKPNINQTTHSASDFGLSRTNATPNNSGQLTIYWHVGSAVTPSAALEIAILRVNSTGTYEMDRLACDKDSTRSSSNGFNCSDSSGTLSVVNGGNTCSGPAVVTSNKGNINYCNSISFNPVPTSKAGYKAILMRIRPLYQGDDIAVKFTGPDAAGNTALPQQGYKITSTGVGQDGASRKLEVYRSFPTLPTVFDFVLYNGSSNELRKP